MRNMPLCAYHNVKRQKRKKKKKRKVEDEEEADGTHNKLK